MDAQKKSWRCLNSFLFLFACCCFEHVSRAERVLQEAVKMEKDGAGDYVMLRNLYATEQWSADWEDVKQIMKKKEDQIKRLLGVLLRLMVDLKNLGQNTFSTHYKFKDQISRVSCPKKKVSKDIH
jgi:hypothetical protein